MSKKVKNPRLDLSKSQLFFIELYPDDVTMNVNEVLDNICNNSVKYAYVLHDRDKKIDAETGEEYLKKPHIHLFCKMPQQMSRKAFSETFGVHPHLVEYAVNERKCIRYLRHLDEKEEDNEIPFQYADTDVKADYDVSIFWESREEKEASILFDLFAYAEKYEKEFKIHVTICQLLRYAQEQDDERRSKTVAVIARRTYLLKTMLDELHRERNQDDEEEWNEFVSSMTERRERAMRVEIESERQEMLEEVDEYKRKALAEIKNEKRK